MELNTLPTFTDALHRLDSFQNMELNGVTRAGLSGGSAGMERLAKRLGSPHAAIPAVHIAGTKGKGSVCHMVAAALSAAGLKTGLYTSPHVTDVRERIQIHGRPISEQRFIEAADTVLREAEQLRAENLPPSWFEVMTGIALVAFREARVEAMVLETGLGGRLDATNLPDLPLVAAGITAISRDHEEILGTELESIAAEKAAIIRANTPVVVMPQAESVMRVIAARAESVDAPVFVVGKDILVTRRQDAVRDKPGMGQRLDFETWRNVYPDIPLAMLGRHQAENAALALGLADLFLEYMDREPLDALVLKRAWRSLALPARMEVVGSAPWRVVDGAHNPASAWAAAETLLESFSATERTLIFGVARDKDWRAMARVLAPLFSNIVLTPYASARSVGPEEMDAFVRREFPGARVAIAVDTAHAMELAEAMTPAEGLILTTGSLWLAGEMRAPGSREKALQS